ncbi:hypothetical protein ACLB2K_022457 [Fragaria x ananassa]
MVQEISKEEVWDALKLMNPSKAPRLDGFAPCFYQQFWEVVGDDVVDVARIFLGSRDFVQKMNCTHVTLIPKVKTPEVVGHLRPISLCNVLFKIGSKLLANRLKPLLDDMISPYQSAYVPGRLISDNSLVAFEIAHYLKRLRGSIARFCALKLDMSKAYDRVEWCFLRVVLLQLGFCDQWVGWIMNCVETVSYSFVINGEVRGMIKPSRGLRQGDSISPYLFLICAKVLSRLIRGAEREGKLHGVSICTGAPTITHLFFAYDSFIFCRADEEECGDLMTKRQELAAYLGVMYVEKHNKYLDLPVELSYSKEEAFVYVAEKIDKRTQGWRDKTLSVAGKEILIMAVLQSIPTYVMSCFELPQHSVMQCICLWRNFGGVIKVQHRKFIGWLGIGCAFRRVKAAWVSETW